jgi:alkylhydroperoxidase family enzyme
LLKRDFLQAGLSKREIALCEFANLLTVSPDAFKDEKHLHPLRNEGISDLQRNLSIPRWL